MQKALTTYHYSLWKTLQWTNHYSAAGHVPGWSVRDLMSAKCKEAQLIPLLIKYILYKGEALPCLLKIHLQRRNFLDGKLFHSSTCKWRLLPRSEGPFGDGRGTAEDLVLIKSLVEINLSLKTNPSLERWSLFRTELKKKIENSQC